MNLFSLGPERRDGEGRCRYWMIGICTNRQDKAPDKTICFIRGLYLAEREGFEPSKGVSPYTISSRAP